MFRYGFALTTEAHLRAAMHNRSCVEIWQDGSILDYGGPIDKITDSVV